MPELDAEHRNQMANLVCDSLRSIAPERCPGCRHVADALAPLVAGWLADAWDEGHRTPKRYGPDGCRCSAWNEYECGCGRYGSNVITPNPYRGGDS